MRPLWLIAAIACSNPTYYPDPVSFDTGPGGDADTDADADADADTDADTDTDTEPLPCSAFGGVAVNLTVVNGSGTAGDLYWRDNNCNEFFYATLPAGQVYAQPTFGFHVWVFYGLFGAPIDAIVLDNTVDPTWVIE